MLDVQLPESGSSQNVFVLDKFSENNNDSKRSDKRYGLKSRDSGTDENMRIILEYPMETDRESKCREEDLKEIRKILSGMLENFMSKFA